MNTQLHFSDCLSNTAISILKPLRDDGILYDPDRHCGRQFYVGQSRKLEYVAVFTWAKRRKGWNSYYDYTYE